MSNKTNNCNNQSLNENGLTKNIFFQTKNLVFKYKNIKDINGKPLISYSIIESLKSDVDETWVSTEDRTIKNYSLGYGARVIDRPKELADDISMPDDSLLHFTDQNDFDVLVFIQPTSPMIKSKYINEGI